MLQCYKANILIDSKCHVRLADFGLTVVIDESTAGSTTSHCGMRGTIRWMAPEMIYPEKFGFTSKYRKRLPSKSTDIYALSMTVLEVSALHQSSPLKYRSALWVGHYGMSPVQRCPHRAGRYMQSPRRGPTGQTTFGVFGSVVGVVSERLVCGVWHPAFQTPIDLYHT